MTWIRIGNQEVKRGLLNAFLLVFGTLAFSQGAWAQPAINHASISGHRHTVSANYFIGMPCDDGSPIITQVIWEGHNSTSEPPPSVNCWLPDPCSDEVYIRLGHSSTTRNLTASSFGVPKRVMEVVRHFHYDVIQIQWDGHEEIVASVTVKVVDTYDWDAAINGWNFRSYWGVAW